MTALFDGPEAYRTELAAAGLAHRAAELLALSQPSLRLTRHAPDPDVSHQASRIGGDPLLGPGQEWPERDGRPLSFLAQIDLAALPRSELPDLGLLSFFADLAGEVWGIDKDDRGGWCITYLPDAAQGTPTRPTDSDVLEYRQEQPIPLTASAERSWLPWTAIEASRILTDVELDRYADLFEAIEDSAWEDGPPGPIDRVLGHPDGIQEGDNRITCEVASNGGDVDASWDDALVHDRALGWRLLAQLDSAEDQAWCYGDMGRAQFWLPAGDLEAGRWDRAWMVLDTG